MNGLIRNTSLPARLLLLVLFISYSASIMMFYHTHELHGVLITHSHPFKLPAKKGTGENHSHSPSQYYLLQHLCETSITDSILKFTVVPDLLYAFCSVIITPHSDPFSIDVKSTESMRAPPGS